MRIVALSLLLVLFAGCVSQDAEPEDPLFAVCPQWIAGPAVWGNATVAAHGVLDLAPVAANGSLVESFQGFPLDLYVLRVNTTGPVQVHARTDDGRDLLLRDTGAGEPDSRPSLVVDGSMELAVYLTAVAHATAPDPSGVRLVLDGDADVMVEGTAWYRVCGAVLA